MQLVFLQAVLPPENLPFLYAGLAVSWAVFFVYAFWISRRQQDLRREIDELRKEVEDEKPGE
ncbi:MAG: hypothetical protein BZY88_13775 [SAR202 cluster bacterium Io17-Chloro-G9]|nr:MAG: hypothetical protein BZY88_13775 [SAR202 cluster bacterium Io17-Chloro-G9]